MVYKIFVRAYVDVPQKHLYTSSPFSPALTLDMPYGNNTNIYVAVELMTTLCTVRFVLVQSVNKVPYSTWSVPVPIPIIIKERARKPKFKAEYHSKL